MTCILRWPLWFRVVYLVHSRLLQSRWNQNVMKRPKIWRILTPFEMFFFTWNDDLLFLMNVPLWIIFFKSHLRLQSILYFHIDGANQHFMLTPTIPLALKFILNFKVLQSHYFIDSAIFGTWVNKCVKIFRSHMKRHLQFGKKAGNAGPQLV